MHKNLVIAFGGVSPEHEVSVLTAIQAAAAWGDDNWKIIPLYISKSGLWLTGDHLLELESYENISEAESGATPCHLMAAADGSPVLVFKTGGFLGRKTALRIDMVLCAFHGSDGENGAFQGLCETANIPYTGSGVTASAMGMDKRIAKQFCRLAGIPIVPDVLFSEQQWVREQGKLITQAEKMGYPLFVKPVSLGSSIGVYRAINREELIMGVESAFRYSTDLLVEKGIEPLTEINCSVLGDGEDLQTSVCEQPIAGGEALTFEDKYLQGDGEAKGMASASRLIPAPITEEQTKKIQQYSRQIFQAMGCSGVARLDFLMHSESGEIWFNEINTIPGSFSFYLWDATGVSFDQLLEKMVSIALRRHREKNSRIRYHDVNLLSQKAVKGIKGLKGSKGER